MSTEILDTEWIGECCVAFLPAHVRRSLSERPAANRPPKKDAE